MSDLNTERDPLEMLAAEYMERLRQGQRPEIEDYVARYPALADDIRGLFPTIAVTERLKAREAQSSGGRATLGPSQPERLGDFRLIREIGRGGMGVVFEAEQESLGRRVAVKVLPRQVLLDEKHLKRFEREARIAANLHHTNIVEVFGVGEQDGFHYYVMQYIRGVGLDVMIPRLASALRTRDSSQQEPTHPAESVAFAPHEEFAQAVLGHLLGSAHDPGTVSAHYWTSVAQVGLQAAEALDYAHSQGVLHRDIKPANLLLDPHGTVWLADFGLAKAAQSEDISVSRDVVGTLRYMAPEQFRGHTDQRTDIYSLGLTLYELLALRPAYEETDQSRLIHRITQGPPPSSPSSSGLSVPRDLETILLKAINSDAGQRYSSAQEMADDLRCFLEDRPIQARRVSSVERLARWSRRNKGVAGLTGSTLLLLVMVAAVASIGYMRTKNALEREGIQRSKAEATASLAIEALDRMFERFSPSRMRVVPQSFVGGTQGEAMNVPSSPILSTEAAALLEEMLPFYDRLAQQTGNSDKLRLETAKANQRVGAIRQRLGQTDEAVKAYRRSIALYEQLGNSSPTNPGIKLGTAQINNELGRIYTSRRQVAEAREAHKAVMALLEPETPGSSASPELRFELARTYYFLGTQERPLPASDTRKDKGPAQPRTDQREFLAKSVVLLKSLPASQSGNPEIQHLLALCYLEGAPVEDGRGAVGKAGADQAIEILARLAQAFPTITDYAYDLSEAYARIRIPQSPIPPEDQKAIEDRLAKSVALLEKLAAQHPDIPDFPAAEARACEKLGAFHRQIEAWGKAEQEFRQAIALQAPLVKRFPAVPSYGLWMATFRIALADALLHRNEPEEARKILGETISTLMGQLETRPDIPPPHGLLALGYSKLAVSLRQMREENQADEAERKAKQEESLASGSR